MVADGRRRSATVEPVVSDIEGARDLRRFARPKHWRAHCGVLVRIQRNGK
jgi:hypothetical protein